MWKGTESYGNIGLRTFTLDTYLSQTWLFTGLDSSFPKLQCATLTEPPNADKRNPSRPEKFFPHITMWGSCFSLCTRRSAVLRLRLRLLRRRILHHDFDLHHLTPLISHHPSYTT